MPNRVGSYYLIIPDSNPGDERGPFVTQINELGSPQAKQGSGGLWRDMGTREMEKVLVRVLGSKKLRF